MADWLIRTLHEIAARPDGPLAMRFYLQPAMAIFFAIHDGLEDARKGRPAYFWALFTDPVHRREMMQDGWKSVGVIFTVAAILDIVYQLVVLQQVHPLQTVLIATLLAIIPYVAVRGPVNRVARMMRRKRDAPQST
ncbi:MAG TPA: hypothetical protein VE422_09020 [Terriglobia bacterium]|nr:hypothetical protein [Terriglobia bacterium]